MQNTKKWFFTLLVIILVSTERGSGQNNSTNATTANPFPRKETGEYRLKKSLFNDYDAEIIPSKIDGKAIEVRFEIALHQILEIDEKGESVTISAFARTYWKDDFLNWNPQDYNNVTSINVKPDKVWVPDITLMNSIDREGDVRGNFDQVTKRVIIKYDGNMSWLSNAILMAKCPMNIKYFPFDTQECELKFSSWTYHGLKMNLLPNKGNVDLGSYSKHTEWQLEGAVHKSIITKYSCCPEPYPEIHVRMKLKRRPLFYILNLILPIILIAFLTMLSFYVPSETGERISYGVTLLLAMTLFMLILAGMIPAASDNISLMEVFFTCVIIEMVLMIVLMCYISKMYLQNAEDGRIYPWMRKYIYEYLAFKFGVRKREHNRIGGGSHGKYVRKVSYRLANGDVEVEQEDESRFNNKKVSVSNSVGLEESHEDEEEKPKQPSKFQSMGMNVIKRNNQIAAEAKKPSNKNDKDNTPSGGTGDDSATTNLPTKNSLLREFDFADTVTQIMKQNNETLLEKARQEKEEKLCKHEWKVCAMTMDYIALIVFSFIFLLISISILAQ